MKWIWLVILLVLSGCGKDYDEVYEYTCWNGGVAIYQEKLIDAYGGWRTLDGYKPNIPYGDVACTHKLIGKRTHKKE